MNVLWHPSQAAIQFVFFLGGLSDYFKSSSYEEIRDLANLIPPIPWHWWALASLIAILFAIFEHSFREHQKLEKLQNPRVEIIDLKFHKTAYGLHQTMPITNYDLFLNCCNPPDSGLSVRSIKASLVHVDEFFVALGPTKRWLRFEDDATCPDVQLRPGEDRRLRIVTFYKKNSGWFAVLGVANANGERLHYNDLEIHENQKLSIRLSADDTQAQEWEIIFGKQGSGFYAKATKRFPGPARRVFSDTIHVDNL